MFYFLTSIWVTCTPNIGQICLFKVFCAKSRKRNKKQEIQPNFCKICVCYVCTQTRLRVLFQKNLNHCLRADLKNIFFPKFCPNSLAFSSFFSFFNKNMKNAYFNQRLKWAAPNCWSNYLTTYICPVSCTGDLVKIRARSELGNLELGEYV